MKAPRLVFLSVAVVVGATVLLAEHLANRSVATAAAIGDDWVNMSGPDAMTKYWFTEGNWSFANGVIALKPRPGEKGWERWKHYLWSKKTDYGDFEIKFDYKVDKAGNSGLFFSSRINHHTHSPPSPATAPRSTTR